MLPGAVLARRAGLRAGTPAEMRGLPRPPAEFGSHALPGAGGRPLPPLKPDGAPRAVPRNAEERRVFEGERAQDIRQREVDARHERDLVRQQVERQRESGRRTSPGAAPFVPPAGLRRLEPRLQQTLRPNVPRQPQMRESVVRQPAPSFHPSPPRVVPGVGRPGGFGGRPVFVPRPAAPMIRAPSLPGRR